MPVSPPFVGAATMAKVSAPPSTSEPASPRFVAVSSFNVTARAFATGASFTARTVIETVAGALSAAPSLAWKVKLSEPW